MCVCMCIYIYIYIYMYTYDTPPRTDSSTLRLLAGGRNPESFTSRGVISRILRAAQVRAQDDRA